MKWIAAIGIIPLAIAAFIPLSTLATSLALRQEIPAERKPSLASPTTDLLAKRVLYQSDAFGGLSSICRGNCHPGKGNETLLTFRRGVVFLDPRDNERKRLAFSDRNFQTVDLVHTNNRRSCHFIAYTLFNHVALLDSSGAELWRRPQEADSGRPLDGVQHGDIDGDKRSEFAIYARYRAGIDLADERGKVLWNHPVYALGHLAMGDVRGNGKQEIIYSNANNADRATVFKTLDARGTVVKEWELPTGSYEFALIHWPNTARKPNLLLTEENIIRVVDLKGQTVARLEAPGCRHFGAVKAVTVALRKGKPAYLAVRKFLHPDLAVLFVYDADQKLVYQETEARRGSTQPAIAGVPGHKKGVERLLVGTDGEYGASVVEYTLALK
jgi:hypothetical protein